MSNDTIILVLILKMIFLKLQTNKTTGNKIIGQAVILYR